MEQIYLGQIVLCPKCNREALVINCSWQVLIDCVYCQKDYRCLRKDIEFPYGFIKQEQLGQLEFDFVDKEIKKPGDP